ncbi:MAG TPA: hypothetical protein VFB16_06580 [Bauldia sp.]|nr:hypothetical protein [Bauldia sp.]
MATDLQFPIVLRIKPGGKILALLIGAAIFVVGVFMTGDEGTTSVPIFGYVSTSIVGYFMIVVGLGLALAAANGIFTGLPSVTLDRDGLVYTPNLARERRVAWNEIAAITTYSERYGSGVAIETRSGRVRKIPAVEGSADDFRDLILRCAGAADRRLAASGSPETGSHMAGR